MMGPRTNLWLLPAFVVVVTGIGFLIGGLIRPDAPAAVELEAVPADWGPSVSTYRYVYSNDRVMLVDPARGRSSMKSTYGSAWKPGRNPPPGSDSLAPTGAFAH
jgi:Protein of unknown function (DUF1236)